MPIESARMIKSERGESRNAFRRRQVMAAPDTASISKESKKGRQPSEHPFMNLWRYERGAG
jgi:hypothetical protein